MKTGLTIAEMREQVRKGVFNYEKEEITMLWQCFFSTKITKFEPVRTYLNYIASGIDQIENLPFYCSLPKREEVTLADLLVALFQMHPPEGLGIEEELKGLRRVMIDKVLISIYKQY